MTLSRYEQIVIQLTATRFSSSKYLPTFEIPDILDVAATLEEHFVTRELAREQAQYATGTVPAFLKRQAE
jgi:hypothetical protein